MSRRSDELEAAPASQADEESPDTNSSPDPSGQSSRRQSRVARLLGRVFSPRVFVLALLLSVAGLIGGSVVPVVGGIARYIGLFLATFLIGVIRSRPAYLETAAAGAIAGGLTFLIGAVGGGFLLARLDLLGEYGPVVAGIGVGAGLLVALAGHYFGRDLRKGVTRDIG